MHDDDWLTARFEESRPRLHAVAYRMLGSHAEADDAVQETWLRLRTHRPAAIENVGGLLTTVVGRVCLDRLRAPARPTRGPGGRVPRGAIRADPTRHTTRSTRRCSPSRWAPRSMVVLDRLGPAERVAFVLHDVFAVPFDDIGEILGRTPDASRQLASRRAPSAAGHRVRPPASISSRQRGVVDAFLRAAAHAATSTRSMQLLDPDVVLAPRRGRGRDGIVPRDARREPVAAALSGGARGATLAIVDGTRRVRVGARRWRHPRRRAVHRSATTAS